MKNFYFKDRNGQTPLPEELKKGLIPKHVQTVGELDEYEEANIAEGLIWLEGKEHKDFLKYDFWLKLHNKLYCDVWKWAGDIRKHELDNPYFNLPHQIWPSIKKLEDDIKFWLENKTYSEKELAARIHERLLTIHPFNNGNGRLDLAEYSSGGKERKTGITKMGNRAIRTVLIEACQLASVYPKAPADGLKKRRLRTRPEYLDPDCYSTFYDTCDGIWFCILGWN